MLKSIDEAYLKFDSYIDEITQVAKVKTAELIQEFKNNIDIISSNLELLINDEKRASAEQEKARAVLELVERKDLELTRKIWGEEESDEDADAKKKPEKGEKKKADAEDVKEEVEDTESEAKEDEGSEEEKIEE